MKKRSKKVSVDKYIESYYKRHKNELDSIFGSERSAKAHLKYDVANAPANYFYSRENAREFYDDYLNSLINPAAHTLKVAKRDAINRHDYFKTNRELNKRIDENNLIKSNKYLGIDANGWDTSLIEYYEIKNSNLVLAHTSKFNGSTSYEVWEYIKVSSI